MDGVYVVNRAFQWLSASRNRGREREMSAPTRGGSFEARVDGSVVVRDKPGGGGLPKIALN